MKRYIPFLVLTILVLLILPVNAQEESLEIDFFYSLGCPHCTTVSEFLDGIESDYPVTINKINTVENPEVFMQIQQEYDVPSGEWSYIPKVFVGDYYCIGDSPCINNLEIEIQRILETGQQSNITNNAQEDSINYIQILGLAAVDAVNPCALAVLVILLTAILTRYPKRKQKALSAGILFTLSIFLCYFFIGLLIILGFKAITGITQLSTIWFYKILGIIAIIIGIFNLKDFFRYGGGGFVMEVPRGWRPKLKRIIGSTTSPVGAFFVGIVVSIFLLPCTSGPYFIAGGILSELSWIEAIIPLVIYNIIFVIPMLLITIAVYVGFAEVEHVDGWKDKNIKRLHLIAGLILVGLGIAMVIGLI